MPRGCRLAVELQQGEVGVDILGDSEQRARRLHKVVPRVDIAAVVGDAELGVQLDGEVVVEDVVAHTVLKVLRLDVLLSEASHLLLQRGYLLIAQVGIGLAVVVLVGILIRISLYGGIALVHGVLERLDVLRVVLDDGVDVVLHRCLVDRRGHHVPVGEDAPRLVDEESGAVQHARLFLDVGEAGRQVDEAAVVVKAGEVEMLAIRQLEVVVVLIADEHHARFLFAVDFLWVLLTAHEEKQEQEREECVVSFHRPNVSVLQQ